MNSIVKAVVSIVVIVLVIWGISAVVKKNMAPQEIGLIKIGLSLPLTGDLAFIGEADRDAANLAMDEINGQKNLKNKYELVIEDDAFNAAKASTVMQKFLSVDKVDAVISVGSTAGNAIAPVAETNKLPHIGIASDANVAKGDYNFINWTRPQEEVDAMIGEMKKRGITKVAIMDVNQQAFSAISADFKTKANAAGITYTSEVFNPGQKDFRTIIKKLHVSNPQIYLLGAFDPEIGIIAKQMSDLGIKTPVTSIESFGLTADPKPFEGQWFVDAAVPTSEFDTKFQKKYGKASGPAAPNTYDAIHLLVQAFETASENGKPTSDGVASELTNLKNYSGALGPLVSGPDGVFISQATVKIIKNGKAELLNQ